MDAAYAGVAAILPEQRAGLDGLELAHSFDTNCHKCALPPAVRRPLSMSGERGMWVPACMQQSYPLPELANGLTNAWQAWLLRRNRMLNVVSGSNAHAPHACQLTVRFCMVSGTLTAAARGRA